MNHGQIRENERKNIVAFKMRILKIKWIDKVSNSEVSDGIGNGKEK